MHGMHAPNGGDETGAGQFTVSRSGTLLYVAGGTSKFLESSLVLVDRKGAAQPLAGAPARSFLFPRLSPNGEKVAVSVRREASRSTDVWVYDVRRGAPTRLTFDGAGNPVWSPDGKRLASYLADQTGVGNLHAISADGSGKPERLATSPYAQTPSSWASAANMIAFLQPPGSDSNGIWVLPMNGERQPRLFLESRFNLMYPELSPDGQRIAYMSNESGAPEVYVQPYPGPGEKTRVSTNGGLEPIWTSSGRELLYRAFSREGQQFFSVAIHSLSPFRADAPRLMFETKRDEYDSTVPIRSWDSSSDGQRFLLARYIGSTDKPVTTMHVVLNWTEELKRLVPTK